VVERDEFGARGVHCADEVGDLGARDWRDRRAGDPHAGVVNILEAGVRKLVAGERSPAHAVEPRRFGVCAHALLAEPVGAIRRRRVGRCPQKDARTVARKQVHRLVRLVDRPYQRAVQPLASEGALRRHAHRPRREDRDGGIVAEMEQAHRSGRYR
jgi:hypothetical protein